MNKVFVVLGWFVLGTLALAIARQLSEQTEIDTSLYAPAALTERFIDLKPSEFNKKREPDVLLRDTLAVKPKPVMGDLTAQSCASSVSMQPQLTGNYAQVTNNCRHRSPESCSCPMTAFVNTVYK
jgi:hypothetical protein